MSDDNAHARSVAEQLRLAEENDNLPEEIAERYDLDDDQEDGDGDIDQDDGNNHVGPIVFADEDARRRLQQSGDVVTFRVSERTTGDTWWRERRTGEKMGDCRVECIGAVDPSDRSILMPYYREVERRAGAAASSADTRALPIDEVPPGCVRPHGGVRGDPSPRSCSSCIHEFKLIGVYDVIKKEGG